jgi:hypothetical protein
MSLRMSRSIMVAFSSLLAIEKIQVSVKLVQLVGWEERMHMQTGNSSLGSLHSLSASQSSSGSLVF